MCRFAFPRHGTSLTLKYDLVFMDQSQLFLCIPLGEFVGVNVFAVLIKFFAARFFLCDLLFEELLLRQVLCVLLCQTVSGDPGHHA